MRPVETIFAALALYLTFVGIVLNQSNHAEDKAIQERNAIPHLQMASSRNGANGHILTVSDLSPITDAAITELNYYVTDRESLERIARVHPRPRANGLSGNSNSLDRVAFKWGYWLDDDCYVFSADVGLHVPAGGVTDIEPQIRNCRLAGQWFVGQLEIIYDNGKQFRVNDVAVCGQPCH